MTIAAQVPAQCDIQIYQGDDWELTFDFSISLTGYTIVGTVHLRDGTTVTMTKTDISLSAGQFKLSLTDSQTSAIPANSHDWCLKMTSGGMTRTYINGSFIVDACP
jgi:hypothetical protein